MSKYAKAIGGAITAIVVYVIAEVGLNLPEEIVAALQLLITGGVVWALRNREPVAPTVQARGWKNRREDGYTIVEVLLIIFLACLAFLAVLAVLGRV